MRVPVVSHPCLYLLLSVFLTLFSFDFYPEPWLSTTTSRKYLKLNLSYFQFSELESLTM